MKIFKYLFIAVIAFGVVSCSEKDRAFTEFDDLEHGAYGRLLDGPNGVLDFEDPAGSGLDFTVEFYDDNNGANVESYDWTVSFPGYEAASIAGSSSSSFTTSDRGLPSTSISFTFQQVLDALGMTLNDIVLGEQFLFNGTITMKDGRTFSAVNTGSNVVGSAPFSGFFSFRQGVENLPCKHALSGTFDAKVKLTNQMADIGWDDCGGNEWTGQVRFEAEHDETMFGAGVYQVYSIDPTLNVELVDLSFGAYYACYNSADQSTLPNGDVKLNFDCNKALFSGTSQWGEVYTVSGMAATGNVLTFAWTNDYGEGAEVTLTRTDGMDWPADMRSE